MIKPRLPRREAAFLDEKRLLARTRVGVSQNSQNGETIATRSQKAIARSRNRCTSSRSRSIEDRLENRYGPDWSIEGSNPSPSARFGEEPAHRWVFVVRFGRSLASVDPYDRSICRNSPCAGTPDDRKTIACSSLRIATTYRSIAASARIRSALARSRSQLCPQSFELGRLTTNGFVTLVAFVAGRARQISCGRHDQVRVRRCPLRPLDLPEFALCGHS